MSFVKRADGITVYAGSHATVRPSLADIRHGAGSSSQPENPEERRWLKQIVAAMMPLEESVCHDSAYMGEEAETISGLWGFYHGTCPYNRRTFDDKYFSPADH